MRRLIYIFLALSLIFSACQSFPFAPTPTQTITKIRFTYWGSEMEKAAIEQMVAAFEKTNPDVATRYYFAPGRVAGVNKEIDQ